MTLLEQAEDALWIVEHDPNPIGYDTETSGLDWKRNVAVGYVITGIKTLQPYEWPEEKKALPVGLQSIYIPLRHGGGGNLAAPGVGPLLEAEPESWAEHWFEVRLAEAFAKRRAKGYVTVGHNIGFDALFSWKHGIQLGRNLKDTQHQATMLDEHQESFSLEKTAIVFGATPKLGQALYAHLSKLGYGPAKKEIMAHYWKTSGADPVIIDYAAGDGVTTLEVYHRQLPFLRQEGLEFITQIENDLIWTLTRMEFRGWKLAVERFEEVIGEVHTMLNEARAKLPHGFNVRSPGAVRAIAERTGHTNWPTTKPTPRFPQGQPSFNEAFLDSFEEGRAILRVRRLEKVLSSFIEPLRDKHCWRGRVHGHLNQLKADEYGTISGRLSASNPNLQQVPARDEELATLIRKLFIADVGMRLYEADYSQQEPRLWAHYSKDPWLTEGYMATPFRDVHDTVAKLVGVSRKYAKAINLGLFYNMWKDTFEKHMKKFIHDITREKTDEMFDSWWSNFSAIKDFSDNAKSVFRSRGWVRTILHRRARVRPGDSRFYVAANRIIQGGSADMTKYKLLEIDRMLEAEGDKAQLLMTVHDSIIFQSSIGDEETPRRIKAMMEDLSGPPFKLTVPFVADLTSGNDWAEVKFGKEE